MTSSHESAPRFYTRDLALLGPFEGGSRTFMTEHPVSARCGDGQLDPLEACDDGNRAAGDGCDAQCAIEPTFIGIMPAALAVVETTSVPHTGSIRFDARDPSIAKGPGAGVGAIETEVTIAYGNGASSGHFALPACDAGWRANDDRRAIFAGSGQAARTTIVENGKLMCFEARGLGEHPLSILELADPNHSVLVASCTTNAGAKTCMCSAFPRCRFSNGNGRAQLICRDGVRDPSCAAIGR